MDGSFVFGDPQVLLYAYIYMLHTHTNRGEYVLPTAHVLYKGKLKEGKFSGRGEMVWFSEKDSRKKYTGEFKNGEMDGQGELK